MMKDIVELSVRGDRDQKQIAPASVNAESAKATFEPLLGLGKPFYFKWLVWR
jgi:hypothetical protein